MDKTPKGLRLHIGIYGRRNVGKSSLLNALTSQQVAIVSPEPGTTTDPVEKPMELLPIGPVLFIDTAGIDDIGALGALRVQRTRRTLARTDVAVLVAEAWQWGEFEESLLAEFEASGIPAVVAFNKADLGSPPQLVVERLAARSIPCFLVAAARGEGIEAFKKALIKALPADWQGSVPLIGDLVPRGEAAVLVVPIDKEAPKGRLILPQVQTIRDLLDHDAYCVVVKENELRTALNQLRRRPAIVVTDSQVFARVAAETPRDIPLTSFSILFARFKGDLQIFVEGALAVDQLQPGAKILVAEACAHHPIGEDIGRVKIPRWLTEHVGGPLDFVHTQGPDFPDDLRAYSLVIHCGACTFNRRQVMSRINRCVQAGVPITNYGILIAHSLGILERALSPFPVLKSGFSSLSQGSHPTPTVPMDSSVFPERAGETLR